MNFCDNCDQLLTLKNNSIKKKYELFCNNDTCDKNFFPMNNEILFIKKNIHKNSKIKSLAETALQDETFPSILKKCTKCNAPKMVYFRLDIDLKKIYICKNCKSYFL
jgi:DNA-directed RNA polymerase subunit M/transcription elongation factor TFIIS